MISGWLRSLRIRLKVRGWYPETNLVWFTVFCAGGALVTELLMRMAGWANLPSWAGNLGPLRGTLAVLASPGLFLLAYRWLRKHLLWRLRNRLIVTYIFIGVIPLVLLLTMFGTAFYLFAGQFSNFLVTGSLDEQLEGLRSAGVVVAHEVVAHGIPGQKLSPYLTELKETHPEWAGRSIIVWKDGNQVYPSGSAVIELPDFLAENGSSGGVVQSSRAAVPDFASIVEDGGLLYLRSAVSIPDHGARMTVVVSEPLNHAMLQKIAVRLGRLTLYTPDANTVQRKAAPASGARSIVLGGARGPAPMAINGSPLKVALEAGEVPPAVRSMDWEITFPAPISVADWNSGEKSVAALMRVSTRPSMLYDRLFAALGEFSSGAAYVLFAVAIVFAILEMLALFIGVRLSRTVTGSVANLYIATGHVNRGDFSHRIAVKSRDQLAELQISFNAMTQSIERLIVEQKEKQRLESELTIAQEVQEQLFPKQLSALESLEVFGYCRPARTVSGDYYDFLMLNSDQMCVALGDISGKGISAALLMATIHSAVRAYGIEGTPLLAERAAAGAASDGSSSLTDASPIASPNALPSVSVNVSANGQKNTWQNGRQNGRISPSCLMTLLNHQLYESTPMEKYATLFLGFYEGHRRRLTYTNAGHLPPAIIGEDGAIRILNIGGTVVGLFPYADYPEATVEFRPGDLFVAWTDGVTEPENDFGEFGEHRLLALIRDHRNEPLARISEIVIAAVDDWIGAHEQPDDVTILLARARP